MRDIDGLYLHPPDLAIVLCIHEKSQIQALDRTQPLLPLGLGYVEGVTHDYVRQGTTTLCAALNVASGRVLTQTKHRGKVARPVSYTTLVLCFGLLVVTTSDLATQAQFGALDAFTLAFVWVVDPVLTPALCSLMPIAAASARAGELTSLNSVAE